MLIRLAQLRSLRAAPGAVGEIVPRAHRMISNLKTWLQGTYHGVSGDHLQFYLDEFVLRFNRRLTPMAAFQTLLGLGVTLRTNDLQADCRLDFSLAELTG